MSQEERLDWLNHNTEKGKMHSIHQITNLIIAYLSIKANNNKEIALNIVTAVPQMVIKGDMLQ